MVPETTLKERYRLDRLPLAHKGMGEVWPARDILLDRPVIVKFVSGARPDPDLLHRFRREALLTARLDHPGVPAIYHLDQHDGRPYIVMQKIRGVTLDDLIEEQGPLPIEWAAAIGAQVASVLLAANRIGLVHRDIKPGNVMVDKTGAVKVLDFGLAAIHGDDRYSRITQSGQSLGTAGYMAPEQVFGEPTDHRTDLYGLGATLFDLLTGRPPFAGATPRAAQWQQVTNPPPRPTELRPEIPATFDELVHALLALHPSDRPANAAQVYDVLAPLAQEPPPIAGLVDDSAEAVRAYAAIVGRVPPRTPPAAIPTAEPAQVDPEQAVKQAERLQAAGKWRAAARQWRRLADERAQQHGDDDSLVFDFRRNAALTHLPLDEPERALRQLKALLRDRIRVDGPEHAAVRDLRQEIERLSGEATV